jgi:D-alanine-D-alanine ligase
LKIINNKLKVAVLAGGIGAEREVSIESGRCVAEALKEAGLNVITADITPDNTDILEDASIDVFFPALHGKFGEDGRLQQILEDKSLLYTTSGPAACKLAFDKIAAKKLFAEAGIDVPAAIEFTKAPNVIRRMPYGSEGTEDRAQMAEDRHLTSDFRLPTSDKYTVKPLRQGSSVGVAIVNEQCEVISAAQKCLSEFGDCMIEEFIPGREITVGILCDQALPIIEVRTERPFYDYQAKYIDEQTQFLFDTITDPALTARIKTTALDCFNALGCRYFARVDFILSDEQKPYILEVNTIPGLTTHSLLPKAAAKAGFSMSRLCVRIIEAALENRKQISKPVLERSEEIKMQRQ